MRQQHATQYSLIIMLFIALAMYVLPWILNDNAVLSLGAYDFAEFLAKRHFDDTSYNTILALRGQLVFLTWLLAFSIQRPIFTVSWWTKTVICLFLIIAQLPPLTFVSNFGDLNQQQQALLSLSSLVGVGFGLTGLMWSARNYLQLSISIIGIMTCSYAIVNALNITSIYLSNVRIGFGGIGLIAVYTTIAIYSLKNIFRG